MAIDMFLRIDGIPGESTDASHKDEIDILSYTWGESLAPSFRKAELLTHNSIVGNTARLTIA